MKEEFRTKLECLFEANFDKNDERMKSWENAELTEMLKEIADSNMNVPIDIMEYFRNKDK